LRTTSEEWEKSSSPGRHCEESSDEAICSLGRIRSPRPLCGLAMTTRGQPLIYSSSPGGSGRPGDRCPKCGWPTDKCACSKAPVSPKNLQRVRVSRTSSGRAGKTVTLVAGLEENEETLGAIAKKLKARCGAGGTVKAGTIEIQGDHVETVLSLLSREGYRPKKSGG
jgi:translation initiation factor 1